jgi:hypothetical protein
MAQLAHLPHMGCCGGTTHSMLLLANNTFMAMLWAFAAMDACRPTLKALHRQSIVDEVIVPHRDGHLPSPVPGPAAHSRPTRRMGRPLGPSHPQPLDTNRHVT